MQIKEEHKFDLTNVTHAELITIYKGLTSLHHNGKLTLNGALEPWMEENRNKLLDEIGRFLETDTPKDLDKD